ncbi:cytochrome P450 [Nocardioides psychrotolerans]|uniref:Sterol 14-demethylase n=1 Tax=Nocardioides psychrotolerans TaxID=1005945 RepID=A0A1I3R3C4_9ACTN|nr:cytochrome P450 [Nocardioides psychrotolerans]GEP40302.1 cytochrome P450 [Nocardioides psychrotolerans]SFJ40179.1 sterol 14-demethylase [Nocardioides psychrotolerans]
MSKPQADIPEVSYAVPDDGYGHLAELRTDPISLLMRVREECGDIGRFRLAERDVVMVSGAEANEQFFRAPDSTLDQAAAYPFMTPIFGEGVVFDASPEERQQMLKNQALRGDMMRGHAATIEAEINRMVSQWGDEGEIDLLDWFAELTIYTTSSCLIGKPFREELDASFAEHYHHLEKGTDALAYVDAYADIESFRQRDAARVALVALVQAIIDKRVARGTVPKEERDLLDVLISVDYGADLITGIFISMMFAGHHTSSGTAAWGLIELMRHPEQMSDVVAELDDLYADGSDISFQALRSIPRLEAVLKETLRLHPPLIILLRLVQEEIELAGHTIAPGTMVAASPKVSNRIGEDFPEPESFDPGRYLDPRQEDLVNRWTWIPFGAGKHRCVGSAFAMMQLKAIFSVILRDYEFEMTQPSEDYRDDVSKMVIQLQQPCRVKYKRRSR